MSKPTISSLPGRAIQVMGGLNLENFPLQSVLELSEIIGGELRTQLKDDIGFVMVTGSTITNPGSVSLPGCRYVLSFITRHNRANPIYLAVGEDQVDEVCSAVEELISSSTTMRIDNEITITNEAQEPLTHSRRSFTCNSQDLMAYLLDLSDMGEHLRAYFDQIRLEAKP